MAKTLKMPNNVAANPVVETSAAPTAGFNWVAYAIWGSLGAGLIMRCLDLSMRAMHHDESIHATFSYQWMDTPDTAYYKYDPTYHGPFLYIVTRCLFQLFGVGVAQARLFPLIFGMIVVFTPLFFRRWLGARATWASIFCLAVSPLQIYYSRFLAHDMPSLTFASASAAALLAYCANPREGRKWLWLSASAMGLLFSVKAVSFLYCFLYGTAAVLLYCAQRWNEGERVLVAPEMPSGYRFHDLFRHWAVGLAFFCLCYGIFQTSLLNHPQGFADGLFSRVLTYWWGQHSVERLTGPTTFHLRSLLLHELPVLLIALTFGARRLWERKWGRAALIALGMIFLITVPSQWKTAEVLPTGLASFLGALKVRASGDIFLYALAFVFGILGSFRFVERGEWFTALLSYITYASLAIYSFAGEKTPWLTLHVLYPMALLAGVAIAQLIEAWQLAPTWNRHVVLPKWQRQNWKQWGAISMSVLCLAYQLRIAYYVNYLTPGEPVDLLSQVHNTKDVKFVVDWMKTTSLETGEKPVHLPITIAGDVVWAFYFYLIDGGFKNFSLDTNNLDGHQRFVILDEKNAKEQGTKLESLGYRLSKLDHSGWWVPEHGPVTWLNWAQYAWNRKPPNPVGLTPLFVYFKPLEIPRAAPALASVPQTAPGPNGNPKQ